MLFQNYGLFWREDRVAWGKPGTTGTLSGYISSADGEVDFREQRGVYVLYDENFNLLYVGQAGYGHKRLYDRLNQHRFDHLGERWSRFSWFGIDPVRGRRGQRHLQEQKSIKPPEVSHVLDHLEAILIASAEPRLNLQGGRFGDAEFFYQWFYEDSAIGSRLERLEIDIKKIGKAVGLKSD